MNDYRSMDEKAQDSIKHTHKFTVVVEWKDIINEYSNKTGMEATKVMCECGKVRDV